MIRFPYLQLRMYYFIQEQVLRKKMEQETRAAREEEAWRQQMVEREAQVREEVKQNETDQEAQTIEEQIANPEPHIDYTETMIKKYHDRTR